MSIVKDRNEIDNTVFDTNIVIELLKTRSRYIINRMLGITYQKKYIIEELKELEISINEEYEYLTHTCKLLKNIDNIDSILYFENKKINIDKNKELYKQQLNIQLLQLEDQYNIYSTEQEHILYTIKNLKKN